MSEVYTGYYPAQQVSIGNIEVVNKKLSAEFLFTKDDVSVIGNCVSLNEQAEIINFAEGKAIYGFFLSKSPINTDTVIEKSTADIYISAKHLVVNTTGEFKVGDYAVFNDFGVLDMTGVNPTTIKIVSYTITDSIKYAIIDFNSGNINLKHLASIPQTYGASTSTSTSTSTSIGDK